MKFLITGYPGFLGRHAARAFKKEGHRIRVLLHRRTVTCEEFSREADECLWGSILEGEVVRKAVAGIDAVIHCAWVFHLTSPERPTPNEKGTELLLEESIRVGVKAFVFISSVAVYGMRGDGGSPLSESSPLAAGKELLFLYPSEKIAIEKMLLSSDRKGLRLGIFRPGPIFDDSKGPIKQMFTIGDHSFALGMGNGRNLMGYIHAEDVAEAVVKWLKKGQDGAIFNVTPTTHLNHREWYQSWANRHHLPLSPIFIDESLIRIAAFGMRTLKNLLGKETKGNIHYAIATAIRNLQYSNEALKKSLDWTDKATERYTSSVRMETE